MSSNVFLVAASNGDGSIFTWNFGNGNLTSGFKGNHSVPHGLCKLGTDYVAAAQSTKQSLHFWSLSREQILQRSIVAEAILGLAASPEGDYLAGGSSSGTLYLWETASGRLLRTWPAHYKAVTTLLFVGGASLLLSGGDDTMVHTWLLPDLLDPSRDPASSARPTPLQSWSDHTLPVTALLAGAGEAAAVVGSASLDRSVKLRRLSDGRLLRSFALPAAVNDMVMDAGEQVLYAAGADGVIYELQLLGADTDGDVVQHPVGATGSTVRACAGSLITFGAEVANGFGGQGLAAGYRTFLGHSRAVTCLMLAAPPDKAAGGGAQGAVLVSGSEDGTVRVWDLDSRLPMQVINVPHGAAVSSIQLLSPARRVLPGGGGGGGRSGDLVQTGAAGGGAATLHAAAQGGGPQRLQPLAALSKYAGTAANIQSWEGPPVVVDGTEAPIALPGLAGSSSGGGGKCGLRSNGPVLAGVLGLPARMAHADALHDAGLSAQRVWELVLGARSSEAVS